MQLRRPVHDLAPVRQRAGLLDRGRLGVSMPRAQRLPVEREQAVPLQIPEGAVIREHVEPVATFARTRVRACAGGSSARRYRHEAAGLVHPPADGARSPSADRPEACDAPYSAAATTLVSPSGSKSVRTTSGRASSSMPATIGSAARWKAAARLGQVLNPAPASIRLIDAHQKRRDDLPQLEQHRLRVRTHLRERMPEHPEQQRFVRLARSRTTRRLTGSRRAAARARCPVPWRE